MKQENKTRFSTIFKHKNSIIGFYFILLQIFIIYQNNYSITQDTLLWFCNHTPIVFAIGFFSRNYNMIKGIINVGFLAQLAWTIDFLTKIIFNVHIFNITNYVFEKDIGIWLLVIILIHLFETNIALLFTYKIKPNKKNIHYSIIYITLIYILTILFTSKENNINWIFGIGRELSITSNFYTILWPVIVFIILVIPTYYLQQFLYKIYIKKNKKN